MRKIVGDAYALTRDHAFILKGILFLAFVVAATAVSYDIAKFFEEFGSGDDLIVKGGEDAVKALAEFKAEWSNKPAEFVCPEFNNYVAMCDLMSKATHVGSTDTYLPGGKYAGTTEQSSKMVCNIVSFFKSILPKSTLEQCAVMAEDVKQSVSQKMDL